MASGGSGGIPCGGVILIAGGALTVSNVSWCGRWWRRRGFGAVLRGMGTFLKA